MCVATLATAILRRLALVPLGLSLISHAAGAEFSSYTSGEGKIVIRLTGEIVVGDSEKLKQIIVTSNAANKIVSGIRLNSPGGSVLEGAELADRVKFARIATVVPNGATCASACFLVFAAGGEKFVSRSARVGVHGAADQNGDETDSATAATVGMARLVKLLGVPNGIIGKMVTTPPAQILWLTEDDLLSMGTKLTGKPAQIALDAMPSKGPPNQSAPNQTQASSSPDMSWGAVVSRAYSLSASQHGGKADIARSCQPKLQICNTAIFFEGNDKSSIMVRVATDIDGKTISRDVCTFNSFGDIRTCLDWDKNIKTREMKDSNGEWSSVN